jgi:hypothetical protein
VDASVEPCGEPVVADGGTAVCDADAGGCVGVDDVTATPGCPLPELPLDVHALMLNSNSVPAMKAVRCRAISAGIVLPRSRERA